jgi:hypothetical protein
MPSATASCTDSITPGGLVVGIVGGLIVAKFIAADLTRRLFGYTRTEGRLIWSLTLPQVAATLATAMVAFEAKNAAGVRLLDQPALNTVLVLVVVTSIRGPMLTEILWKTTTCGAGGRSERYHLAEN